MTEIILNLAALLLAVFCLVYSLRRRPASTPRRGLSALRGNGRALFSAMAAILALSAATAVAEGLALAFGAGAGVLSGLRAAYLILQIGLLVAFMLYAAALLTRRGSGEARGGDAPALLPMAAVAAVGVAVRLIWHVRVDLFFEAVALFGGAALAAQGESSRDGDRRFRGGVTLAVALTLLAVIAMNVALILNLSRAQSDEIGNDVIRSDLQDTITEAETQVLRVAIGAEQLMESGASREALSDYFVAQRDKYLSDDDFMNVYIAGRDWHIIPDFDAPKDFHA